jgi:hypothetical protein
MKKAFLFSLLAAGLLWAAPARAEYVCEMFVYPASAWPSMGTAGGFGVAYYTGPDCTGTLARAAWYCSTGATSSNCGTAANCNGTDNLISSSLLYQMMGMVQQAMFHNQKVWPNPCNGVAPLKAGTIEFWAN